MVGGFEARVDVARCVGESSYSITLERPGASVTFDDEGPGLVAVHHTGSWVWLQRFDWFGKRSCEVRALGSSEPAPWPEYPPRAEVRLVSELVGPGCPGLDARPSRRFFFAEDVINDGG